MKFLCKELGTQGPKENKIKGKHSLDILMKALNKFIEKYVACSKCHLPELCLYVDGSKKRANLLSKC